MSDGARVDPSDHAAHPWRINGIAADFELIDAWALPATGPFEAFADLRRIVTSFEPEASGRPSPAKFLFVVRDWLGKRFGWDDDVNTLPIPGCEETSLRDRLPADLDPAGIEPGLAPFRPVYLTDDEWALELSNSTVHAILHLGWVPLAEPDLYRGQMGVYVKTRGRLGKVYMMFIAPFRHFIVYPALLRRVDKSWQARGGAPTVLE